MIFSNFGLFQVFGVGGQINIIGQFCKLLGWLFKKEMEYVIAWILFLFFHMMRMKLKLLCLGLILAM